MRRREWPARCARGPPRPRRHGTQTARPGARRARPERLTATGRDRAWGPLPFVAGLCSLRRDRRTKGLGRHPTTWGWVTSVSTGVAVSTDAEARVPVPASG